MADAFATSFATLNYSGLLFNSGNTRTPFSSAIGGRKVTTNHVEFACGVEYAGGGSGSQPAISENASLTAPDATKVTRSQTTNVTQIFQETLGVSYAKESNMGTLSGLNVEGQQANPMNELDFQVAARMQKIARDIEYTFIRGAYNKASSDSTVNKSRGIMTAITTSVKSMSSKPLGLWDVADMQKMVQEANGDWTQVVLWLDAIALFQLNADAQQNGLSIVPAGRDVNGIQLSKVLTPMGEVLIHQGECLASGTAGLFNLNVCRPVEQPVPGKGNFFLEELAKVGAGRKFQIFGQVGLDHGPEWYHAKATGIATTFTAPAYRKVYVVNADEFPAAAAAADSTPGGGGS